MHTLFGITLVLIVCQYLFPHETEIIKKFETYISMAIYISKSSSQKSLRLKYKLRTGSIPHTHLYLEFIKWPYL